jgi:hypothetical protein
MEKENSSITLVFIQVISKTGNNTGTVNLLGKMVRYIEAILKMVSVMDRGSILMDKIQQLPEDFGKMDYLMETESTSRQRELNINVYGKIVKSNP